MISQLVRNIFSAYTVRFAMVGASIFLFPFIAHKVGLTLYGIWLLISSVAIFFIQTDFGMGTSTIRYVAEARAREDETVLSRVASSSLAFFSILGIVATVVFMTLMVMFWSNLNIPPAERDTAIIMLVTAAVSNFLIGLPLGVFRSILIGLQRYDVANFFQLVQVLLRVVLIVSLLLSGFGILAVAFTEAFALLTAGVMSLVACFRLVPGLHISPRLVSWPLLKSMAPYSLQVFILSISALVILYTDNLIIGLFLPIAMVTLYSGAYRIYQVCRDLTNSLTGPLIPDASRSQILDQGERLRTLFLRATKYANALVLLVGIPAAIFAEPVLMAWAGQEFAQVAIVAQILLLSFFVNNNHTVALSLLTGVGRVSSYTKYHVVWALSNLGLSILLVQRFGLVGVALGTAIPIILLEPLYIRTALREFGVPVRLFLSTAVARTWGPALLATLPVSIIVVWADSVNLAGAAILSVLYALLFLIMFFLVGLDRPERAWLLQLLSGYVAKILRKGSAAR